MPHATPEARREYQRAWRARNREQLRDYQERRRGLASYTKYEFPTTLTCSFCGHDFTLSARPTKTGPLPSYCSIECHADAKNAAWRPAEWLKKYGLTADDYARLLKEQDNRCACCGEEFPPPKGGRTSVCVDHCHTTGRVRGMLCSPCNVATGKFEKRGERIAAYLARTSLDLRDLCGVA